MAASCCLLTLVVFAHIHESSMGAGTPIKLQMPPRQRHLSWSYSARLSLTFLHPNPQFLSFMPLIALRSSSVHLFSGLSFLLGSTLHEGVTCCVLAIWHAALQLCKGTYSVGFGALNWQGRKGIVEVQTLSSQGHSLFLLIAMFSDCWEFRCSYCLMLSSFSIAGDEGMRDTLKRNFDVLGVEDL